MAPPQQSGTLAAIQTQEQEPMKKPRRQRAKQAAPLYSLEQLLEAVGNEQTVFIVENEEAADALIAIGIPATTNGGGWHEEFNASA
jgi:hypothetical protein